MNKAHTTILPSLSAQEGIGDKGASNQTGEKQILWPNTSPQGTI